MKKKLGLIIFIIAIILIGIGIGLLFLSPVNNSNKEEIERLQKELAVEGTTMKLKKEDNKYYYFEGKREDSEEVEYEIKYNKQTKKFDFISKSTEAGGEE